jgi:hypothetical protein
VQGTVSGKVADIQWRGSNGNSGTGFIAATGTGLLVGLTWAEGAIGSADAVVALQRPSEMVPITDVEARELKWVGYDLARAGKHAQAANALTKVVRYLAARSGEAKDSPALDNELTRLGMGSHAEPATDPSSRRGYLIDQGVPLFTLADSAFRSGQFTLFVYAIHRMMLMRRAFGHSPHNWRAATTSTRRNMRTSFTMPPGP